MRTWDSRRDLDGNREKPHMGVSVLSREFGDRETRPESAPQFDLNGVDDGLVGRTPPDWYR
jgi:hypothetical protein